MTDDQIKNTAQADQWRGEGFTGAGGGMFVQRYAGSAGGFGLGVWSEAAAELFAVFVLWEWVYR